MPAKSLITTTAACLSLVLASPGETVPTAADYTPREIHGWTVRVQNNLNNHPRLPDAIRHLDSELASIVPLFPAPVLAELKKVPIWLSKNSSKGGAAYHPSRQWLENHGRVPEMERSVEIKNIDHFLDWSETQPAMVLHELAHAWHHRRFNFKHPAVTRAFKRARAAGTYQNVLHKDGKHKRHYALTNEKEYFAELTESTFEKNDFQPFDRSELAEFDPEGLAMVLEVWGISDPAAIQGK